MFYPADYILQAGFTETELTTTDSRDAEDKGVTVTKTEEMGMDGLLILIGSVTLAVVVYIAIAVCIQLMFPGE